MEGMIPEDSVDLFEYYSSHLQDFSIKYPNKYIAVTETLDIMAADSAEELDKQLKEKNIKRSFIARIYPMTGNVTYKV